MAAGAALAQSRPLPRVHPKSGVRSLRASAGSGHGGPPVRALVGGARPGVRVLGVPKGGGRTGGGAQAEQADAQAPHAGEMEIKDGRRKGGGERRRQQGVGGGVRGMNECVLSCP